MTLKSDKMDLKLSSPNDDGEGDDRGWDGWMPSLTRWTWVWVNSGRWWWTGRPDVLRFMGSQRVGHDWATELNDDLSMWDRRNDGTCYTWFSLKWIVEAENFEKDVQKNRCIHKEGVLRYLGHKFRVIYEPSFLSTGNMELSGSKVHQSLYISIENNGLLSWIGFLSSILGHGELCREILMGHTQGETYLCKR